jgi:peptidoglycan/LPS O-acetylase OafA/YrhL
VTAGVAGSGSSAGWPAGTAGRGAAGPRVGSAAVGVVGAGTESGPASAAVPGATRFAALDGYRALACLLIVVAHVPEGPSGLLGAGYVGFLGVAMFFTLSGFLLYRPFVLAHLAGRPRPGTGRFLRRRLLRIYPAYLVALTGYLFVFDHPPVGSVLDHLKLYGFLQIYDAELMPKGIPPAWTLCTEMSFYLALPLLAIGARALARAWWRSGHEAALRAEVCLVAGVFLVGPLFRMVLMATGPHPVGDAWLPAQADYFGLGMALAVASAWLARGGRVPAVVAAMRRVPWLCYAFALELLWLLGRFELPVGFDRAGPGTQVGRNLVYLAVCCCLVVPAAFGSARAAANRFLASRPLHALSEISYALYLWHMLWQRKAIDWLGGPGPATFWSVLYIGLLLALTSAVLSYYLVERPAAAVRDGAAGGWLDRLDERLGRSGRSGAYQPARSG